MSEDLLLKELAQVVRDRKAEERSRFDERWDRLSAGTLSPEEEAELRALAETSEQDRGAYEAFRPLGAEFQASVVQKIRSQGLVPAAEPEATKPPPKVLPFRRSTSQTFRRAGWSAIAASALFVMVRVLTPYPLLPVYTAELSLGDQEFRSGTGTAMGVPVFSPGSTITLVATPEPAVTGPVKASAFAARGEELIPLDLELSPAENGAVRLRGTLGEEIRLSPGNWRLWIVVGRPRKIPDAKDLQAELRAGQAVHHEDWQAVSGEIRVEERQASP